MSLTIRDLVTPAFDLVHSCTGDLRRAGIYEVAGVYVVTRLFDLGVIGWFLYLYMDFKNRMVRTPQALAEALFNGSHEKNCIWIYIHI